VRHAESGLTVQAFCEREGRRRLAVLKKLAADDETGTWRYRDLLRPMRGQPTYRFPISAAAADFAMPRTVPVPEIQ
jgi:hypothetical protein